MTMYAPSDVRALSAIPDGCGTRHEAPALKDGEHWHLDCPPCEAVLSGRLVKLGFSARLDGVALTCDERRLLETQEKEGNAATAILVKQLGSDLASALRTGGAAAAEPSPEQVVSALKGLPQDKLAELLKSAGLAEPTEEKPTPRKRAARKPAAGEQNALGSE
ncbi:hypothetical protein ACWGCW_01020 [Streptomyces sp. NPDC054933]